MSREQDPREGSPRAHEGGVSLSPPTRGRSAAPHLSTHVTLWLPIAAKIGAAAIGAAVLAFIGAKSGAHAPPRSMPPEPSASAAPPPVIAAAFMVGLAATAASEDGGARAPAHSAEPEVVATAEPGAAGLLADGRVVLNEATESELTKLPGIGPSRARAILALRQRLNRFKAVEDLLRVKGIGRKMLRRLRPNLVLDRPADRVRAAPSAVATADATATGPPLPAGPGDPRAAE